MIDYIKDLTLSSILAALCIALCSAQAMEETSEDSSAQESTMNPELSKSEEKEAPVEKAQVSIILSEGRFGLIFEEDCCIKTSMIVRDKLNVCMENDKPWGAHSCFSIKTDIKKNPDEIEINLLYAFFKIQEFLHTTK